MGVKSKIGISVGLKSVFNSVYIPYIIHRMEILLKILAPKWGCYIHKKKIHPVDLD